MKSPVIKVLILALAFNACQEAEKQRSTEEKQETNETKAYIPVTDYIKTEIRALDSTPTGILKRINYKNGTDSVFINPDEFKQLAQAFLPPELDKGRFERSFTESSFIDQTTESLTFTYESVDNTSAIRRVDVLLAPSLEVDKIKSVYIEKMFAVGDTAVEQKMYWKAGESFQITTLKSVPGHSPDVHQLKVIWDPFSYNK